MAADNGPMPTMLITGSSGLVASMVRPGLRDLGYRLRLLDLTPPPDPDPAETVLVGSFTDPTVLLAGCDGADVVLHLGGHSGERSFEEILTVNVAGTQQVLQAAYDAGIHRVVLASSVHAVGAHPATNAGTAPVLYPRPDSFYGVGKVALEALGSLYADRFGMTTTSLRICTADFDVKRPFAMASWLSPADAVRLIHAAAQRDDGGHRIVWGVSDNEPAWFDRSASEQIGYHPQDHAGDHTPPQVRAEAPEWFAEGQHVGGPLATDDYPVGQPWD